MLSDKKISAARNVGKKAGLVIGLLAAAALSSCQFQPLYGTSPNVGGSSSTLLSQIGVDEVETRVGQQVRNHLLFLLNGGNEAAEPKYTARLQVSAFERKTAASSTIGGKTAGFVTVTASYSLTEGSAKEPISSGSRKASAHFDRTSQIFANQRAVRDAENRAGIEVAEKLRFAFASALRK